MTSGTISIKKRLSSASAGQQQHSVSHRWPQNDRQTHFPSLSIFVTHTHERTHAQRHAHKLHRKDYWDMVLFWEGCHQQRLICEALLYPNSVGNTSAFRSFQKAAPSQIPATHHLTLPLVLNLIFPPTQVNILVVLALQPLDQLSPLSLNTPQN